MPEICPTCLPSLGQEPDFSLAKPCSIDDRDQVTPASASENHAIVMAQATLPCGIISYSLLGTGIATSGDIQESCLPVA
jgi:hypothetical protein